MSITPGHLEAGLAGAAVGNGIQRGLGAYPGVNNGYGQGYLYDMYYYICEESSNWWKILLWVLGGLLLAGLIICGIVALALIPVYINSSSSRRILAGPRGSVNVLSALGNSLATTTPETLTFWDATTGRLITTFNANNIVAARQINEGNVVAITSPNSLSFFNANGATNTVQLPNVGTLNDVFVNSPNQIYVGTGNGRLLLLNADGTINQDLDAGGSVTKITKLENGDIVTVDTNKRIKTWRNNQIVNDFAGQADAGAITNLEASNGLAPQSLVYTIDSTLYVVNTATGAVSRRIVAPGTIRDIEILRNGAVAVATGRSVNYYNLNTGNAIRPADNLDNTVTGLTSNSNNLFAGTSNGDTVVLDPYTGSNFNAKSLEVSNDELVEENKKLKTN